MENGALELKNLIQGFKLSCQTEYKSPKTIARYIGFLNRFHNLGNLEISIHFDFAL